MPFGICSAPEVFQRKMHETIEGLDGIEVVADDFLVIGCGENDSEALASHDQNLIRFLERCQEKNLVINADKLHLRQTSVPFIGHVTSKDGLSVDPAKVKAILGMPAPEDRAAVQRLLGMVQYLTKFLPRLAEITKPLRDLTQKDKQWQWDSPQVEALAALKEAVSSTPVLRYYSLGDEVTIQCDASQFGLGAALLQKGQPVAFASRALTPVEVEYAQIEKEMLAIVYACEHFDAYLYGREKVHVQTDHRPLESILRKPLHLAPKRLQRMMLRLQRYDLDIEYVPGRHMYLADTLSRAPLAAFEISDIAEEISEIDCTTHLPVSDQRWTQLNRESAEDPVLHDLRQVIKDGWPPHKSMVPVHLHPYFDIRDELTVQNELIFKGHCVVVPKSLRKELMEKVHASHIGIGGCIRKAREALYWPRMSLELKDYISKCDICLRYRSNQSKEPLIAHDVGSRPWARVAVDLAELDGRTLLIVTDYFSSFVEVARLNSTTAASVIRELKEIFSRFGIPDEVITDNRAQFASGEFQLFARSWEFVHRTSSPRYPQSNGKVENAVQTVKRLFKKCKDAGQSEFLALLDWRNTPTEGMSTSPAQRLFGRRCKTLLPLSSELLEPHYDTKEDRQQVIRKKRQQKLYYDKGARPLPPLYPGDHVQMKLPGQDQWSPGLCVREVAPRSYLVNVDGSVYRRNRRQLVLRERRDSCDPANSTEHGASFVAPGTDHEDADGEKPVTTSDESTEESTHQSWTEPELSIAPNFDESEVLGRGRRCHKPPVWQKDYIMG